MVRKPGKVNVNYLKIVFQGSQKISGRKSGPWKISENLNYIGNVREFTNILYKVMEKSEGKNEK